MFALVLEKLLSHMSPRITLVWDLGSPFSQPLLIKIDGSSTEVRRENFSHAVVTDCSHGIAVWMAQMYRQSNSGGCQRNSLIGCLINEQRGETVMTGGVLTSQLQKSTSRRDCVRTPAFFFIIKAIRKITGPSTDYIRRPRFIYSSNNTRSLAEGVPWEVCVQCARVFAEEVHFAMTRGFHCHRSKSTVW